MNLSDPGILIVGLLFLATLVFGFWVKRAGRPLNILLFTLHKLIALGAVILTGKLIYGWLPLQPVALVMTGLLALCVLALFVSGALLSREKTVNGALLLIHRLAPVGAAISSVVLVSLAR